MLLVAHDLREEIARETKYGKVLLAKGIIISFTVFLSIESIYVTVCL